MRVRWVRQNLPRITVTAAVALAAAALIVAVLALREARDGRPTYGEVGATSVAQLGDAMTPDDVRALLGTPATVIRDNPRALCWGVSLAVRSSCLLRPEAPFGVVVVERPSPASRVGFVDRHSDCRAVRSSISLRHD